MNQPPPFPAPPPVPKAGTWWSRNWLWFVPVCILSILLLLGGCVGFFALIFGVMKSSDVYKTAVARAEADPGVIGALGTPIKEGFLFTGSINVSGAAGNASLAIPISGPNGKATIYVEATKSEGVWTFSTLDVVLDGSGQKIDLKDKAPASSLPASSP